MFCLLVDVNESFFLYLLNYVDKNGNFVFYFFLKSYWYDIEELRIYSEDRGVIFNSDIEIVDSDYMYELCILVEEVNVLEEGLSFLMFGKM